MEFANETPHFFKVFLLKHYGDDDLHVATLGIPRKFERNHGHRLSDSVLLTVPSGDLWDVKLVREDGEVFLRDGWAEFSKHYGIVHGSFAVFRLETDSRFLVLIFDVTACEIDYPVKRGGKLPFAPKLEDVDRSGPVDVGKASCSLSKRGVTIEKRTPGEAKRKRGRFDSHLNCREAAKTVGTCEALARACSYRCVMPSFVATVGHTSFYPRHYMYLPTKFLELGILKQGVSGYMTLLVPDGKTWTVGYRNGCRCTISRGWREFVLENNLRTGDVLVFELISTIKVTFRVVIFRDDRASQPCPSSANPTEQEGIKSARRKCSSSQHATSEDSEEETPSFEAVISTRDTKNRYLYIPARFAKPLARVSRKTKNKEVTLKVGRMSWPVQLRKHMLGTRLFRITTGWANFVQDNHLVIGDVCVFKLVRRRAHGDRSFVPQAVGTPQLS